LCGNAAINLSIKKAIFRCFNKYTYLIEMTNN
jgi:hypothetical protein